VRVRVRVAYERPSRRCVSTRGEIPRRGRVKKMSGGTRERGASEAAIAIPPLTGISIEVELALANGSQTETERGVIGTALDKSSIPLLDSVLLLLPLLPPPLTGRLRTRFRHLDGAALINRNYG
jgi:hypothetical protein